MPTTPKERILAEIRRDEVVALARDLVSIPSYTTEETATCARVFGATTPDVCG
jgi:hypothetical protein